MASARSMDARSRGEIMALHCNFMQRDGRPCACKVEVGWLTNCSHLLCQEHAKEWFSLNVECPICRSEGPVRLLKVDFRKPKRERSLAMLGFLPSQVFQAAGEAFEFWAQQKMLEHDWQVEAGKKIKAREAKVRSAYQERAMEVDQAISMLSDKKRELTERLHDAVERGEQLKIETEEARRKLERARHCCDALQATDDGWQAASTWRTGSTGAGRTDHGAARDALGLAAAPPPPLAFAGRPGGPRGQPARSGSGSAGPRPLAFSGAPPLESRQAPAAAALGLGARFGSSSAVSNFGVLQRRGLATPAGFCGISGLGKRRRIT